MMGWRAQPGGQADGEGGLNIEHTAPPFSRGLWLRARCKGPRRAGPPPGPQNGAPGPREGGGAGDNTPPPMIRGQHAKATGGFATRGEASHPAWLVQQWARTSRAASTKTPTTGMPCVGGGSITATYEHAKAQQQGGADCGPKSPPANPSPPPLCPFTTLGTHLARNNIVLVRVILLITSNK